MKSKRSLEGYTLIDHRNSPGLPLGFFVPGFQDQVQAPGGQIVEIAMYTCKHCQTEIVKNPERVRPRGYCPGCDHYICDRCEGVRIMAGGGCQTVDRIIDNLQEEYARNLNIAEL